jgi:hypothetical protein
MLRWDGLKRDENQMKRQKKVAAENRALEMLKHEPEPEILM